ncbi:MAG: DUF4860 domain-containing protein [Eubacterium sp.]|nr:DUF4860 domain-containing protein [Eubacterium sp.]
MNGRDTVKVNKSKLDVIFVLTLFMLFAASLLTVTVACAHIYRDSGERISERFDSSTAITMVVQKIRAYDHAGGIELIETDSGNALRLNEEIDGTAYSTYIYYRAGGIYELFNAADTEFVPENGILVIEADAFKIEQDDNGAYIISVTVNNSAVSRHVNVRTGGAEQ